MKFKKFLSVIYFLCLSYIVFGIRIFPKMVKIRRGYNLHIWESYSDIGFLYEGQKYVGLADFFGNILLFLPFAFCLRTLFKIRGNFLIFIIGFLCTICIEITQYIFRIGFADINDVLTNTLGTFLGLMLLIRIERKAERNTTDGKDILNN